MIDQTQASSNPALLNELVKRHLQNGKPKEMKVKMTLKPTRASLKSGSSDGHGTTSASNQWEG